MNTMHLFAGRGGGLLADLILGHNPIIAVEWNHESCENLREKAIEGWYPNLHVWEGDVRLFDPSEYKGRVDCIHAGFPCQDISNAGNKAGVGEGTRSGLYREVLRIAGKVKCKYIWLENVAAIVNNGLGTVLADISKMGYDARWCIVSASDVGAKHQRERWWCLCVLRDTESQQGQQRNMAQAGTVRTAQVQSGRSGDVTGIREDGATKETSTNIKRNVAYTNMQHGKRGSKPQQSISNSRQAWAEFGRSSENVSNTNGAGHNSKEQSRVCAKTFRQEVANNIGNARWWETEPSVCRVVNGIPNRLHKNEIDERLFGLGNAQVPLSCAVAWKILTKDLGI